MATTASEQYWIPQVETFGDRLLVLRRKLGLGQDEAARLCGISPATWYTWENKGRRPRAMNEAVNAIHQATGVDRDWLMWGTTNQGSNTPDGPDGPSGQGTASTACASLQDAA